jgi:hypothetical protein
MPLLTITAMPASIDDLSMQELVEYYESLFGALEPFTKRRLIRAAWALGWDRSPDTGALAA